MRKVIMQQWVSLDGFAAGLNDELNFFTDFNEEGKKFSDFDQLKFIQERLDTLVLGRRTYKLFVDFWPTPQSKAEVISDALNSMNKVVISNSLKSAPWGDWSPATISSGEPSDTMNKIKTAPGKDIVVWGSISVAQNLMLHDLIDEYHLQVCPVILGEGRPLFPKDQKPKNLKLRDERKYSDGVVFLEFERVKE